MKKFILGAMTAALALTFVLSGCGDGKEEKPDGGGSVGGGESEKALIENPWWSTTGEIEKDGDTPLFEDIDITLATVVNGEDTAALTSIIDEFNVLYSGRIHVDVEAIGEGEYENTVATRIANNSNPPDLLMSHQKGHKAFAENKLIQPFDEAMEKSGIEISMNDYSQGLAQYADLGYTGYTFGVPIDAQSSVVYYNKTLLAKYGNKLPETREELLTLCDNFLKGEKELPIQWSTTTEDFFPRYILTTAISQNGGYLYDDTMHADWYSNAANRKAFTDATASIRELVTKGFAKFGQADSTNTNAFCSDKALFYVALPWNTGSLLDAYSAAHSNLSLDTVKEQRVGATTFARWFSSDPASDSASLLFGDSHFFAMSKSVKDITKKAAICEFVKWFTQTPSVGAEWAEAGHANACTIVTNSDEYMQNDYVQNYLSRFYPNIDDFRCIGNTPYWQDTVAELKGYFSDMLTATTTEQDEASLKRHADKLNESIDFFF